MGGTMIVSLHLDDISNGTDAVEEGTLIALLTQNRKHLSVRFENDEVDPDDD